MTAVTNFVFTYLTIIYHRICWYASTFSLYKRSLTRTILSEKTKNGGRKSGIVQLCIETTLWHYRPVCRAYSSGSLFVSGSMGFRFISRASQTKYDAGNASQPLQHFFQRSCVVQEQWHENGAPIRYAPLRKTASIIEHLMDSMTYEKNTCVFPISVL